MRDLSLPPPSARLPPLARFSERPGSPTSLSKCATSSGPPEEVLVRFKTIPTTRQGATIFPCLELGKESLRSFPLPETSPYCSNFCLCPQQASIHTHEPLRLPRDALPPWISLPLSASFRGEMASPL